MQEMDVLQLPPPIYSATDIGRLKAKDGTLFSIFVGLNKKMVAQLKEKSLDQSDVSIQSYTSDRKRFGERPYEEWYGKERTPFALIEDKTNALAAIAWFGPKPLGRKSLRYLSEREIMEEAQQKKGLWHTIVYRSYPPFRGKGFMTVFLQKIIECYLQEYPNIKLWAGINGDNLASIALASKLGFEKDQDSEDSKANWFAMVKKN